MSRCCAVLVVCVVVAFLSILPVTSARGDEVEPSASGTAAQTEAAEEEQAEPVIEVEVRAERDRPAHVDVIRAEELKQMPGVQNVGDAIQRLPGTQTLTGCVMNSPRPSLRGSSYTWLQVLVDGIPVNPVGACTLNRVSASGLGELEVVRGPAAPKYPGNTVSGVLSMRLKTGDQFPGGEFSATGGSFGTQIYDLQAGGGSAERNYFLSYNRNRYTGWMPKDHVTDLTDIAFKAVTALGEDSQLTVVGTNLSGEKQGFRPSGPNPFDKWEHRWPNLSRPAASITYTRKLSPRADLLLRVSPLSLSYDLQYQQWDSLNLREVAMQTKFRYSLLRSEIEHNYQLSPQSLLSWGMWWQRDRMRQTKAAAAPALGAWSTRALTMRGLFAQNTFVGADGHAATIGLRWDDTEPGEAAASPFLSTRLPVGKDTALRLAIARNKRFPVLDELYGVGVNTGNPDLKPHTAWNYEADLEGERPHGRVTLALFRQDHTDMILLDATYTYQNLGKARIQGVEIGYEGWLENGSWWASYSLLDAKDLTKDRPLILAYRTAPPKHMLKAGLTIHRPEGLSYTVEALGYGSRRTDVDQPTPVGEPWNVVVPTSVPSFVTVNVKVIKELSPDRSLFLSVENLVNRDYDEILFYQKPGRWVNLGFTQRFE